MATSWQTTGISNGGRKDIPLEEILSLTVASGDESLVRSIKSSFPENCVPQFLDLTSLLGMPIHKPNNLYLIDLINLPVENYGRLLDKIKQIRAINVETKVILLVTDAQQSQEAFNPFKEANFRSLVEHYKRPDHSVLTQSEYADTLATMVKGLPGFLYQTYKTRNGRLENVEVVKIGGSIFDLYIENPNALRQLLATIVDIHTGHNLILTVGGGPLQSVPTDYKLSLGISDATYQESSRVQITQQALTLVDLLRQIKSEVVAYIPPEFTVTALKDGWITREFLEGKIPVFSYLPEDEEMGIPKIPYSSSDMHTIMFADRLGSRKVIFAKNTDGIYRRDPHLPIKFFDRLRESFRGGRNELLEFVYAQKMVEQIERLGLNLRGEVTDEHLIETLAIEPFIRAANLYTIQVVNGTKPRQLVDAMDGIKAGSYILK